MRLRRSKNDARVAEKHAYAENTVPIATETMPCTANTVPVRVLWSFLAHETPRNSEEAKPPQNFNGNFDIDICV